MWHDWLGWAGIIFVVAVLVELCRLDLVFLRVFLSELKMTGPFADTPGCNTPLISVIVPAKDEEQHIEQAARAALASNYKHLEIILVNDRSADKTPQIMERLTREDQRVKVISISELPPGWTGKTHAMFQAAKVASGTILLFTDADAELTHDAVSRSVSLLDRERADMVSFLPNFARRGFIEDAIYTHLALGISFFYPLCDVNDPTKPAGLASGCFIMIRRGMYEEIGTWSRFRGEVTEDVAMSKAVKSAGGKLIVQRGNGMVRTRPFVNIAEVSQFWKRTYYGGLERSVPKILRLTSSFVSLTAISILFAVSGLAWLGGASSPAMKILFILTAIGIAAVIVPFSIFIKTERGKWWYGLTAPIGIAISAGIALNTLVTVLSDSGIRWRGSTYK
jgi:chlorobactene glucosyltransferase